MISVFCLLAAAVVATNSAPVIALVEPTAAELIANCREMLPKELEASGRVIVRNRRGIIKAEHAYTLKRSNGATTLVLDGAVVSNGAAECASSPLVADSAVTWSDLTLDYLNWSEVAYAEGVDDESVHGQKCRVVELKRDGRRVRAWIDRKTGALMQAEETAADGSVRRLWGTRLKKFNERWVPAVLEVETLGTGLRTKITVEDLK